MNNKKLGRGLDRLLSNIDAIYDNLVTKKQLKRLHQIQDKSVIDFIIEISNNDATKMDICLEMYNFLEKRIPTPKKNKNYKNSYVVNKYNEISNKNKDLKVKERIQLTADALNISWTAVRNHIYKK